jgi:hypothetical protein
MQTFTLISTIKFECEQLISDMKQLNDWLKISDHQLNKFLVINLNTADEKNDAAKKMLVNRNRFLHYIRSVFFSQDKLDEFAIQEAHREQMKQRAENLFKTLDDTPLQANLDDLDRTFVTVKQQIQV